MSKKNPKLKKNGGEGTFVGNALRSLVNAGKTVAPELLDIAGTITGIDGLKKIGDLIDGDPDLTEEDKSFLLAKLQMDLQAFQAEVSDRKSARALYEKDSLAQKILAGLFVVAYFCVTWVLLDHFFNTNDKLNDYELGLVSTLFGAMSAKVNTIIDFYFGGSMQTKNEQL